MSRVRKELTGRPARAIALRRNMPSRQCEQAQVAYRLQKTFQVTPLIQGSQGAGFDRAAVPFLGNGSIDFFDSHETAQSGQGCGK